MAPLSHELVSLSGGQFRPVGYGQFQPVWGGQFKSVEGGQFHRILQETIDNHEMALFPFADGTSGISGALAKGEIYKPTIDGVVIYFNTENIDETLKLATANGGQVLYPKTDNGIGLVAEMKDTEGNRIALYQSK